MPTQQPLQILKEALLLEQRGRAFYQKVADQSRYATVREFFQTMADEELRHAQILEEQFRYYKENQTFSATDLTKNGQAFVADTILSEALKTQIAAASYEAAAIAAAMLMEEQAVNLYAERARKATDPNEKELYRWLTEWEHTHLTFLVKLEREIKEAIWNDQQFWPF